MASGPSSLSSPSLAEFSEVLTFSISNQLRGGEFTLHREEGKGAGVSPTE